jgi:hypothetical protein
VSGGRALAALRPALSVLTIAGAGLAVTGVSVLGLRDGRCFTSPPEQVAEQFVRKLATRRWGPARAHLAPEVGAALPEEALRGTLLAFEERWGAIEQVEGRTGPESGSGAWAFAKVTTSSGARRTVPVPLLRRDGVWRVAGLEGLTAVP